ncbi:efflux RND transporter periplasmic adaptor subunit [Larsenimonas rhizosphaerae]|uniref:HlyD family secretion protein n=1 Tax=Larsenimonas rhizosphaerae TaxID=2944682 RepID=A0AA41ZM03_9GAMM|nr:HlyD family secretion protein [Larsenimonas rhizosphaerae]MCX2524293.1 HlyD family secretion protein [Larsenimonas rhizosphaerae]
MVSINRKPLRLVLTLALLVLAGVALYQIWQHYMHDPWTRDGRVRADIVHVGVDVSGLVDQLNVHDNERVSQGQVLFTIDKARYELALSNARANLTKLKVDADNTRQRYQRRRDLKQYVSDEERNDAEFSYRAAQAAVSQAEVAVSQAQLDLERAVVKSPVDGYITNLLLRPGQYVNAGAETLTLVDANSFYVQGYFEETKLSHIHPGDPARIKLMAWSEPLKGHVNSIARGITDNSLSSQSSGLTSVDPTFDWVRLSQRLPVRITIDDIPDDVQLSAGLTATVYIGSDIPPNESGWRRSLRQWLEGFFNV